MHYPFWQIDLKGGHMVFTNPLFPFELECCSETLSGYLLTFNEDFIAPILFSRGIRQSPFFDYSMNPAVNLDTETYETCRRIFEEMAAEESSDYRFKEEAIQTMAMYLTHIFLEKHDQHRGRSHKLIRDISSEYKITHRFLTLLEEQFPVSVVTGSLNLRTPQDYADKMGIHRSTLNRAIKATTEKKLSEIITQRLIVEAKRILSSSNLSIEDIAYLLGFSTSSYFCSLFRKSTGVTPKSYRAKFR